MPLVPALAVWPLVAAGAIALARKDLVRLAAAAMLFAFFLAGASWQTLRAIPRSDDIARAASDRPTPVRLRVRVRDVPLAPHPDDPDPRTGPFVVDVTDVHAADATDVTHARREGTWRAVSGRAVLYVGGPWTLKPIGRILPGDRLELLAAIRLPREARAPGAFDRRKALAREGIGCELRANPAMVEVVSRGSRLSPRRSSAAVRSRLAGSLRRTMRPRESELFCALLLGYRPGIDPEDRARFAGSGLGHLLAVSGLHLAILAGLLGWLLKRLGVGPRPLAVALAVFAIFYASLAGGRPPIVRAATMVVTYLAASFLGRDRDLANSVAFAAFALLVWRPGWIADAGFQLSFAAVAFIAFLYPVLEDAWAAWRGGAERFMEPIPENRFERAGARVRQAVFVSVAAWFGVQPLLVHYLGFMNPWGVLSNVAVFPLATVALAGGVMLVVAGAVWAPLASVFAYPARAGLWALLTSVDMFAGLPGSVLHLPSPGGAWLAAYYAMALVLFLRVPSGVSALRERISARAGARTRLGVLALAIGAGIGALVVSAVAMALIRRETLPAPSVTVLDLGRARAAVVRTADGADCLVNAGSPGRRTVLAGRLLQLGVGRLACAVITCDEEDHTAGVIGVLETVPIEVLALPAGSRRRGGGPISELLQRARLAAVRGGTSVLWPVPPDEFATYGGARLRWRCADCQLVDGERRKQGWTGYAGRGTSTTDGNPVHPVYPCLPRCRSQTSVALEAGSGLEVVFFQPRCDVPLGRIGRDGRSPPAPTVSHGHRVLVLFPPSRPGPSQAATAARAAGAVRRIVRAVRPEVALVTLSGAEGAFPGAAAALRALRAEGVIVLRTDADGTIRARVDRLASGISDGRGARLRDGRPAGRLVVERWADGRWERAFARW
ncbi:MAG: ComEC/Rec2 family competence protein [Planctomycetota bacterium]